MPRTPSFTIARGVFAPCRGFSVGFSGRAMLVGSLVLGCVFTPVGSLAAVGQNQDGPQPVDTSHVDSVNTEAPVFLSHHGAEGTSGATLGSYQNAVSGAVTTTVSGQVRKGGLSDSLWGNLILQMALQRDPEIQRLIRKMGRVNAWTLASVAGVSGLGLAQSIYGLDQIQDRTYEVTPSSHGSHGHGAHDEGGHGEEGHDHVNVSGVGEAGAIMGVIGSGVTLGTLGLRAVMTTRYNRLLTQAQERIQGKVEALMVRIEQGESRSTLLPDLIPLVGERAAKEFLQLMALVQLQSR